MKILQQEAVNAARTGQLENFNRFAPPVQGTSTANGAETPAATVNLSPRAQEIAKATASVNETPDIREDLVQSLKSRIDSGTYNVSGSDIAEMILRRQAADQSGNG